MSDSVVRRRREHMANQQTAAAEDMAAAGGRAEAAAAGRRADVAAAADAGAADGVAAAGTAADERAAVGPEVAAGSEATQIIGQEMVLASQALVVVPNQNGSRHGGTGTPQRVGSPGTHERDAFQSPVRSEPNGQQVVPMRIPNGVEDPRTPPSLGNQDVGSAMEVMQPPSGQPVSYGPVTPPSNMLPLFTPEQYARLEEIQGRAPFLYSSGGGSGGLGQEPSGMELVRRPQFDQRGSPGQAVLHRLGYGFGNQGLPEAHLQQEMMWKAQMEQHMELLGLQLRASQSENFKLREEVKRLVDAKNSSRYQTPDDRSSGSRTNMKEDGPRGRQAMREEILRAQEEMIRQMTLQEDGVATRQERSKEDGVVTQQDRSQEEGARARQETLQEDGAEARQEREDGAESQQEQESLEEGSEVSSSEESQRPRRTKKKEAQSDKSTMKVILKLVEGMTNLQKQITSTKDVGRQEEVETVRFAADLPKLADWQAESSPIDLNDWILCIEPYMADLSTSSEEWWAETLRTARQWYSKHMTLTPIQRLTHHPQPSELMKERRWSRLERRASSLLMGALPESLKEEVISAKAVTALGILRKSMAQYQPGGLSERTAILSALESPPEAPNAQTAVASLRKWIRWKRRAIELEVSIPDSTILVKGLAKLVKKVASQSPDLNFRLSLVRNALQIDTVPTQESVSHYSEHLLAELEQVCQHARKKETPMEVPKVRKFEEGGADKEEKRGKGKPREDVESKKSPCRYFLSEAGCRRGKSCPFGHVMDGERRCWNCGSKDHLATQCNRGEEAKAAKVSKANAKNERIKQEIKEPEEIVNRLSMRRFQRQRSPRKIP